MFLRGPGPEMERQREREVPQSGSLFFLCAVCAMKISLPLGARPIHKVAMKSGECVSIRVNFLFIFWAICDKYTLAYSLVSEFIASIADPGLNVFFSA